MAGKMGLLGPYRLSFEGIDGAVARRSAGVYALGRMDRMGNFQVRHIGRSDSDVASKLRECIGSDAMFKFTFFGTAQAAFEKECELFHDFSPPGNRIHPGRCKGTRWECPRCRIFSV
ncbi:hypothetical protein [Hyphomicrobium sulfonivorans]|uniref:hypothetical protein n=1 Tax=Hyphomicrobium sulfonivorans TaxID=121290 RepID=UPI00156DC007|nr:hypothetical protein [Hyphomicrobium sulfonivorans]MBI1648783.1 hypothetical protein [Hyphomicrobium sulfonivorans]NSL70682.1 hypothetical protein [Hyphomicrobium sulfonivorans]